MQTIIRILADGLIIPIVLMAGYALLFKVRKDARWEAYAKIIMAGLTAYLTAKLIAAVWQPDAARPFELTNQQAGAFYLPNAGFPSDHALFAMFLTLAVWYQAKTKKLATTMLVFTILMCLGRVLALVHTPLDVVGGIIIACFGALWYLQTDSAHAMKNIRSKRKHVVQ